MCLHETWIRRKAISSISAHFTERKKMSLMKTLHKRKRVRFCIHTLAQNNSQAKAMVPHANKQPTGTYTLYRQTHAHAYQNTLTYIPSLPFCLKESLFILPDIYLSVSLGHSVSLPVLLGLSYSLCRILSLSVSLCFILLLSLPLAVLLSVHLVFSVILSFSDCLSV